MVLIIFTKKIFDIIHTAGNAALSRRIFVAILRIYVRIMVYFIKGQPLFREDFNMRAVITVIGKDDVGILAKISAACAEYNNNILEVTQSVLQELFVMIMLIDTSKCAIPFTEFADKMAALGEQMGLSVRAMHEDIFNSMHRI